MRSPRVLAVDIGAGHVACGVFTAGAAGRLVLQQFAIEAHSSDPSHEARWATEIAQSLGAVSTRHKLGGISALAVPGHLALTKFIKTPSMAKEKRGKIIAFEAAENIPYPLEEVVWDHLVVADDGFDLEVMLTAAKFESMQTLCTATDSAGFPAERAVPAALALNHAFRYNYPEVNESVIVINVGARSTNLLFMEGERFYVRTLALAGNRTLANPTNVVAGQSGSIVITQDATGSRTLAYGGYWKFAAGTAPSLTVTANAVDVLVYYVESATRITAKLVGDTK